MPVERLRLRPWLEQQIEKNTIPGLKWIDREKKTFRVAWKHASRQGWKMETDASLFRAWAIHTGKFRAGQDIPIPKTWKANFRCALNALPDIVEIRTDGKTKGLDAYKVYRMLPKENKSNKAKKSPARNGRVPHSKKIHRFKDYKPREKITTDHNEFLSSACLSPVHSPMSLPMMNSLNSPTSSPFSSPFNSPPYSGGSPIVTPTSPSDQSWSQQWNHVDPLRDHDYYSSPPFSYNKYGRVLKDIGVTTFGDIKQEPGDFVSTGTSPIFDLQIDENREFPDLSRVVKEEVLVADDGSVPTDQEIINLVDELSNSSESFYGSDSSRCFSVTSPTYSSSSSLSDVPETPVSPLSPFMCRPTSFPFPLKTENNFNNSNMGMQCTLTMSPDCTRDLFKRIGIAMHQGTSAVN